MKDKSKTPGYKPNPFIARLLSTTVKHSIFEKNVPFSRKVTIYVYAFAAINLSSCLHHNKIIMLENDHINFLSIKQTASVCIAFVCA